MVQVDFAMLNANHRGNLRNKEINSMSGLELFIAVNLTLSVSSLLTPVRAMRGQPGLTSGHLVPIAQMVRIKRTTE